MAVSQFVKRQIFAGLAWPCRLREQLLGERVVEPGLELRDCPTCVAGQAEEGLVAVDHEQDVGRALGRCLRTVLIEPKTASSEPNHPPCRNRTPPSRARTR